MTPTAVLTKILTNATNLDIVTELVAEDATYVSLNYHNPDLTAIEPWCGTHLNAGPAAIHQIFVDVNRYWEVLSFEIFAAFSGTSTIHAPYSAPSVSKPGTDVAIVGRFKYKSRSVGRVTDSPFCVWARVDETTGKVTYMQFMEDTLDTAKSFRKRERWCT